MQDSRGTDHFRALSSYHTREETGLPPRFYGVYQNHVNPFSSPSLMWCGRSENIITRLFAWSDTVSPLSRFIYSPEWRVGTEGTRPIAMGLEVPWLDTCNEADVICSICIEQVAEGSRACKLMCKHWFHISCILPWINSKNTCPNCRERIET